MVGGKEKNANPEHVNSKGNFFEWYLGRGALGLVSVGILGILRNLPVLLHSSRNVGMERQIACTPQPVPFTPFKIQAILVIGLPFDIAWTDSDRAAR